MDCLTTHTSLSPIQRGFAPGFVNYKIGVLVSQPQVIKVYQLLAHGRWFSPGTPVSSTTKTGRHDIAEILLKVALNTKNKIKSNHIIPAITSKTTQQFDKPELYFSLTHPLLVVFVDIYITVQMKDDLCVMPLKRSFHTLGINWSDNISL
jgi:hypothetical protein